MSTKMLNGLYKTKKFHGKGIRLINMGELFAFPIIKDQKMALLELNDREKKQYIVQKGDLIFARRSLVVEGAGKCSIIGEHSNPMSFESSMIRVRLNSNKLNPKFVFHFLKSKEGRKRIRRIVGFTTVAGIASSDLAKVNLPNVSLSKQDDIVKYLDGYDETVLFVNKKIEHSKTLLKSLINQVF